ncbi:MAG: YbhB/YbcL family Raf kinase inhibitor-like protein [Clostridia bacterium]
MKVTSSGLTNGVFDDKYGKRGSQFSENGIPTLSIPFKITEVPSKTISFAIVLEDKDAYPISGGFAWIHWLAANIRRTEIFENESQNAKDFIQGANSWTSHQGGEQSVVLSSFYGGMCPPDAPHLYELHVYALDCLLDLESGFLFNELHHKMDGHILGSYTLKGLYGSEEVSK